MIAHLGKKLLVVGVIGGAAYGLKRLWHGAGKTVPVTPHGATVTPGGTVVTPPPAVAGGANPAPDVNADGGDVSSASTGQAYLPAVSDGSVETTSLGDTVTTDFMGGGQDAATILSDLAMGPG